MMDRFEHKLTETLASMREDPPDTLTNQVMARIRMEKPKKNPMILWIGMGSVVAGALIVAVVFGTGIFNAARPADMPAQTAVFDASKDEISKKAPESTAAMPVEKGSGASGGAALGAKPGESVMPGKTVSRPATKEELEDLKSAGNSSGMALSRTLPNLDFTVKSQDTWKAWTDLRYATEAFTRFITAETLPANAETGNARKTYKMTAMISSRDVGRWLEAARKTVGSIKGEAKPDKEADMVNITVIFEPK